MHIFNQVHGLGWDLQKLNLLIKVKTFPEGFYPNQVIIRILEQEFNPEKNKLDLILYMPRVNGESKPQCVSICTSACYDITRNQITVSISVF